MDCQLFQIGGRLNKQVVLQLAADLSLAESTSDLEIDFSQKQHFEGNIRQKFLRKAYRRGTRTDRNPRTFRCR